MYFKPPHPTVSAIICTLNEEKNLQNVLPRIPKWVDEIIIVDGHSSDRTVEVAKQLLPDVKILYQPKKGKGDALKYGIAEAKGEIIVTLDGDGTYPPEELSNFVEAILEGYEFAKGTRFKGARPKHMPKRRLLGNSVLVWSTNVLFGTNYTDVCSGYNAFLKSAFQRVNL